MKLLLTSGGVTNPSIHTALVQLLGKPVADCHALCVPTAQWGHPMCGPTSVRGLVAAEPKPDWQYLSGLGWASLGVLELTALPSIGAQRWVPWVREADVLLVDGGDATYLCHWMRESVRRQHRRVRADPSDHPPTQPGDGRRHGGGRSDVPDPFPVFNPAGDTGATLCTLTLLCDAGDAHPSDLGYRAIADLVQAQLPPELADRQDHRGLDRISAEMRRREPR